MVHEMRDLKHDAYICYYPFSEHHECPDAYKYYDAPQTDIEDHEQDIVILPEVATPLIKCFRKTRVAIWWLSVDNYYFRQGNSWIVDAINKLRTLYRGRVPIFRLRQYLHFTQSAYAHAFLQKHGINSMMLTDYLSAEHLKKNMSMDARENIIAYNPAKGQLTTKRLIASCPDFEFIPIHAMTKADVADLLRRTKIYIDFGHHPGKDRLPREAAAAGCCVITGIQGSARNDEDIPIPRKYKLHDDKKVNVNKFRKTVTSIFDDFESHTADFNTYRAQIQAGQEVLRSQANDIFGDPEEKTRPAYS
jgi:hypothetical protein